MSGKGKEAKKEETTEAAPKKSKKMLIIVVALVVLIGGLAAAAFLIMGKKSGDSGAHEAEAAEEEAAPEHKFDPHKPPIFVALEPFTVNLAPEDGNEQYLQVVASLRVADEKIGEEVKALMPEIRHDVLSLLSGKKASEITTPDGREELADEIKDICNEVMGWEPPSSKRKKKNEPEPEGPIVSVYFTQFIVQ